MQPQIVEAFKQVKGCEPAPALLKLKKCELAKRVSKAIVGTGWLSEPLLSEEVNETSQPDDERPREAAK